MLSLERLAVAMYDRAAEVERSKASAANTEKAQRVLRVLLIAFNSFVKNSRSKLYSTMYDLAVYRLRVCFTFAYA